MSTINKQPIVTELARGELIRTQGTETYVWEYTLHFPDGKVQSTLELPPLYTEDMARELILFYANHTWRRQTTKRTVRIAQATVGWAVWIIWNDDEKLDGLVLLSPPDYSYSKEWARACAEVLCEEQGIPLSAIEEVDISAIPR